MKIDPRFRDHFENKIAQVFIYLIDRCNLRCAHCLYKSELAFQMASERIPYTNAVSLMESFFLLGASKITFIGGEPTLHPQLPKLIHEAKRVGYSYIRIDTNGQFLSKFLKNPHSKELDEISFSLDGYNKKTNDPVRGEGSFERCVDNIELAVAEGYNVHVTHCAHSEMTTKVNGELGLVKMIEFCKDLGVSCLNIHDLMKSGIPRDHWTGTVETPVDEYMTAFLEILEYKNSQHGIDIRMPQCLVTEEEFARNPEYFGYCSVKEFDRILAFPNGMLRVCSLMIGTPYCVGYYDEERIYWNQNPTNETLGHEMDKCTACTNRGKGKHYRKLLPLCVSFKPAQQEPVWLNQLKWESRRKTP